MDYYEWLESNIHGITESEEKEQLISLISEIFKRLPLEDLEIIMYKRPVRFAAPIFNCTAEQVFINPMFCKDERHEPLLVFWLVCLSSNILKISKEESLYTVAHELAHVYLEHSKHVRIVSTAGDELLERELEADRQVIKWGFELELRRTPTNYIYGEGKI